VYTELHTVAELEAYLAVHNYLDCVVCQGLDLTACSGLLSTVPATGAAFLGCRFEPETLSHVIATGGLVFPPLPGLPYRPYRSTLYTIDELMGGYEAGVAYRLQKNALDAIIYRHFSKFRSSDEPLPILEALAQRLHDLAIDDALAELLTDHPKVVAIMGGHNMLRTDPAYRDVALIARGLTEGGYFVATGGGPGAMEAGNLGAWFAAYALDDLDAALAELGAVPGYKEPGYLDLGLELRRRYPDGRESLSIPTWFYGHEPTNPFASHIAKYFANSIREDVLLAIATSGVIFSPGSAGTLQEVFMDAAQNHYGSFKVVSPMVFFGEAFWTRENPAFPLLQKLAADRRYSAMLNISDFPDEIVDFIKSHLPVPYENPGAPHAKFDDANQPDDA
jgi:predicted Rossmann-fold nucleotide-binding protein